MCVSVCVQVNPGHGDFRKHVGLHSGREDQAVRPGQQSALQAVQTGQTLTSTSPFVALGFNKTCERDALEMFP